MTRYSVNVDGDQYDEIEKYCKASGATKSFVVREAIALWLRKKKPGRMEAFDKERGDDK